MINRGGDYFVDVSLGRVPGREQFFAFGVNEDIATTGEDIISQGGNVQILSSNTACEILSDSANDTNGGTGTRVVQVQGVQRDGSGNLTLVEEIVTLNGTTAVSLTNTYIAILQVANAQAGSSRKNVGTITVRTTGLTTLAQINPNKGLSLKSLRCVPDGFTMLIHDVFVNIGVVTSSSVVRKGTITARVLNYKTNSEVIQGQIGLRDEYTISQNYRMPLSLNENQFIWFRADTVENAGTSVVVSYTYELVRNVSNR